MVTLATRAAPIDRGVLARSLTPVLLLIAVVALIRLATLGAYPLLDNTEARYALIGRLIVETGSWIVPLIEPDRPFWAKPPLSMWGTAVSYVVFGVNEFAARLPSFLVVAGTAALATAATLHNDRAQKMLAALIFVSTGLAFYLAGAVMTDQWLMLGITLTMVAFWKRINGAPAFWGYLFFAGLAVSLLAKGPIGVVLPGLAIGAWVAWHNRWIETWRELPWISGTLLMLALALPWYLAAEWSTPGFLRYFLVGEHFDRFLVKDWAGDMYGAPRTRPFGTIWLYALAATLPWSALAIGLALLPRFRRQVLSGGILGGAWQSYMLCWLVAPLLFFTAARAVLITYVVMSLPAFALLMTAGLRATALDERRAVLGLALIVPMLSLIGLSIYKADPDAPWISSQARVVAAYERQASGGDLVYFPERPHSAEFYSGGRAKVAANPAALEKSLGNPANRIAMRRDRLDDFLSPDMRARLVPVAEINGTALFRPRQPGERNGR